MNENWKCFSEFNVRYYISDKGNVKLHLNDKEFPVKHYLGKHKYAYPGAYILTETGEWKIISVHRLVAKAFIPNPDNLPMINHKDENKLNPCVENLEWCDDKYNSNYGTRNMRISEALTGRKLSEETKQKMSLSKKGHKVNMTDEWKKKISEANKGKSRNKGIKRSKDHCEKLSASMKNYWKKKKI